MPDHAIPDGETADAGVEQPEVGFERPTREGGHTGILMLVSFVFMREFE